jgi:hypothetical protein
MLPPPQLVFQLGEALAERQVLLKPIQHVPPNASMRARAVMTGSFSGIALPPSFRYVSGAAFYNPFAIHRDTSHTT